ncbi:polyamine aminopropyltransferase [Streptomyces sp. DSM 42041]|uniref:Polyamine aminopropyltransferase n=1 Tax=Streptomyces hazeniae TaxID=3075538 RepID=A0ABU2NRT2_9ACTN|nr:polyamine aminopropyltransferase [Streptomyces sp. DSM 42041]MDT0379693.1 polyamine aminopropyltransferase [Streptomyces sp. DSM 42041]
MIDQYVPSARLPVPAAVGRAVVLVCVFVCAACGLVYELELVALAASLIGDPVTQASVVLAVMVFAMGVGSLLAKRLRCRAAVGFGLVEGLLALVGGGSAMALYASFAWFGATRAMLVALAVAIGVLIGAEMPLLMTLIQRIRRQDPGGAVADLFAADYVGALVGGLAFPFLLLPFFGQLTGALLTGVVNAVAGGVVVLWLFRHDLGRRARCGLLVLNGAVCALLALAAQLVSPFEHAARQALYGADVRVSVDADGRQLVLTGQPLPGSRRSGGEHLLRFFVDGRLRVSSADEERYHEALVHPAFASGPRSRVLLLGGGDGLALREILGYRQVRSVTVLAQEPGVVDLARTDPVLARMNGRAFADPRVRVVAADAFHRLRARDPGARPYDVIVSDLPGPQGPDARRLYSQEFYGLLARALAPTGRLAVHAGPPDLSPRDFWTVEATLRAAGLATTPYAVGGRVSGHATASARPALPFPGDGNGEPGRVSDQWGFVLAAPGTTPPAVRTAPPPERPALSALTGRSLSSAVSRAGARRMAGLPSSTLMHPRYDE